MTENVRRRSSKWDIVPETHFQTEIRRDNAESEKASGICYDEESKSDFNSSKSAGSHFPKGFDTEAKNAVMSKDGTDTSYWEPISGDKGQIKDGDVQQDCKEISPTIRMWDGDQSHSMDMSPGLDAWREQSRSPSPKSGSRRPHRSRSRSPSHGFLREGEGWNDRSRSGTVGSPESRGSRHDRGRYSRHSNNGNYNDSRNKISHGYGSHYDGDWKKHEGQRNNRSIPRCNDFTRGKCYRGSACKYLHHGDSAEGWPRERERTHDRRGTDVSFELDQRRGPHRSGDTPCKFFAVGRCRNGDRCRFSHDGLVHGGPEGSSCDDTQGYSLNNENNISWGGPKWSDEALRDDGTNSSHCVTGNSGSREGVPESNVTGNFTNSTGMPSSGGDRDAFSHCMDSGQPGQNTQDLKSLNPPEDVNFRILPTFDQNMNHYALPQQQHISPAVMQPIVPENVYMQQQPSLNSCKEGNAVGDSTKSHENENFFANNLLPGLVSGQSFNQNGQSQHELPQPPPSVQGFNLNGHGQQMVPLLQSNGQSFNMNGHIQQLSHPQLLDDQEESVKNSDMLDMQMSPITSEPPVSQNMIPSEQVAQIAQIPNLSASLAQIFGNEQITQLYATLNNGLVPPLPDNTNPPIPTGASFIQPDQGPWSHKPCEPVEINNHPPGFSSNFVEPKNNFVEESGMHLKSIGPLSTTGDVNDGSPSKYGGLKEKQHPGNEEFKQQAPISADSEAKERSEVAIGESKKEEQTGHLEDTDADGRVNEESKRGKDPKVMRMFKFALVELVKEILKPAWKEGHISKEAHNTIVKKVVAKVTGTIQGPQIPQTQEKIDHYLSHSKPKLTKLVQAYVEKHSTT